MFNYEIATIIDFHSKIVKENLLPKSDASVMKVTQLADQLIDYVLSRTQIRDKFDASFHADVRQVMTCLDKENEWSNIPATLAFDVILVAVIRNILVRHDASFNINEMKYWKTFSKFYFEPVCRNYYR